MDRTTPPALIPPALRRQQPHPLDRSRPLREHHPAEPDHLTSGPMMLAQPWPFAAGGRHREPRRWTGWGGGRGDRGIVLAVSRAGGRDGAVAEGIGGSWWPRGSVWGARSRGRCIATHPCGDRREPPSAIQPPVQPPVRRPRAAVGRSSVAGIIGLTPYAPTAGRLEEPARRGAIAGVDQVDVVQVRTGCTRPYRRCPC